MRNHRVCFLLLSLALALGLLAWLARAQAGAQPLAPLRARGGVAGANVTPTAGLQLAPLIAGGSGLPALPPPLPPPTPVAAIPPIDFASVRAGLQAQGLDLAFNKIGFHTGPGGNATGIESWMAELDAAGVPFFLKSVDDAGILYTAQQLALASGVSHTLVFRRSGLGYDIPDYSLTPEEAAQLHWENHMAAFPPELDPSLVWLETVNEVDKNRSEWLAEFSLNTAQLALADGYRWAAFAWSSGEPEEEDWQSPAMLELLALMAAHPDRLAIALHEYSFTNDDIASGYPYLVGRLQQLFQVADAYGIPRPTVLITEWGWEYNDVPDVAPAMEDIAWASWLYAAYPQVKGAAIWYLGGGFGGIADRAQQLIAPVRDYSLSHYFVVTPGTGEIDPALFLPQNWTPPPQPLSRR